MGSKRSRAGFTIVELLIVIVVIGILAAIVIVAYRGIQNRAHDTAIQSDMRNVAQALEQYKALNGVLPQTQAAATTIGYKLTKNSYNITAPAAPDDTNVRNLIVCLRAGGSDPAYGMAALSKSGSVFFHTSGGGFVKDNRSWVGQQTTMCPRLGIQLTDPNYSRNFAYENGWKTWVSE